MCPDFTMTKGTEAAVRTMSILWVLGALTAQISPRGWGPMNTGTASFPVVAHSSQHIIQSVICQSAHSLHAVFLLADAYSTLQPISATFSSTGTPNSCKFRAERSLWEHVRKREALSVFTFWSIALWHFSKPWNKYLLPSDKWKILGL